MRNGPDASLGWLGLTAAELIWREDKPRKEFGILPRYFKARLTLLAWIH